MSGIAERPACRLCVEIDENVETFLNCPLKGD
jgi:hypothetical protein